MKKLLTIAISIALLNVGNAYACKTTAAGGHAIRMSVILAAVASDAKKTNLSIKKMRWHGKLNSHVAVEMLDAKSACNFDDLF